VPSCRQIRSTRLWFTHQPSARRRAVIRRYPYRPYSLAIQTIRFTSRGSSSATLAVQRCVFLACPSTRHARRSVTSSRPSVSRTCSTAWRRFAGLRSFPKPPPEGSPCRAQRPPGAASAERSPSRDPSVASPDPSAAPRTPASTGSTSARSRQASGPSRAPSSLEPTQPPPHGASR